MSTKVYTIVLITIVSTFFLSAQFTEKRIKHAPSMNTLKESCCTTFAKVLHASADLLSSVGAIQKKGLSIIESYAQADKQGWCATASREKLSMCNEKLEKLQRHIEELQRECEDIVHFL